jgi:hypothetical protein
MSMHGKKEDLPVALQDGAAYSRNAEWGEMNVAFEGFSAGMDTTPIFKELPDGRCQCPHWGYVLSGKLRFKYADHDEVISAGEAYYAAPGHNAVVDEDCEIVEFSPKEEYQKTMEAAVRFMTAMRQGG